MRAESCLTPFPPVSPRRGHDSADPSRRPLDPPPTGPAAPQLGYGPIQGSHSSSLSRIDVRPAHRRLEWAPSGTVGDVPSPYGEVGARGRQRVEPASPRVPSGWYGSGYRRHGRDLVRFDIVPTTTTTMVTSLTGPARLFCQKARDRPGLDARRDRVPETSLAFERMVSTTTPPRGSSTCGRVHGRAGLRQVPQKRLKRAHRAPDEHGL